MNLIVVYFPFHESTMFNSFFFLICINNKYRRREKKIQKERQNQEMSVMHVCVPSCFSRVPVFAALWTVACQTFLPMGFFRQEYWSGCHALLQGIFLTQESNLHLLCLLHWQGSSLPLVSPGKPNVHHTFPQDSVFQSMFCDHCHQYQLG